MIDLRLLRTEPDLVAAALARRGLDRDRVDQLLALDERRRSTIAAVDEARAEQKLASSSIGRASPTSGPR
jgi:seryl-tRNA synthetase